MKNSHSLTLLLTVIVCCICLTVPAWSVDLQKIKPSSPTPKMSPTSPAKKTMEIKGKPDLMIESMEWSAPVYLGNAIGKNRLNVKIKNRGNVPAVPFQVKFSCEPIGADSSPCPPELTGIQHSYAPLAPNNTVTVTWPNPSSNVWQRGSYRIRAEVDPANLVRESNDQNNTKTVQTSVNLGYFHPPGIQSPAQGQRVENDLYLKVTVWPGLATDPISHFIVEFQHSSVWPGNPPQWEPTKVGGKTANVDPCSSL